MAISKSDAKEKYAKQVYDIYLLCERNIDRILVDNFNTLKEEGKLNVGEREVIAGHGDYTNSLPWNYKEALIELIKEKYEEWDISYGMKEEEFSMQKKKTFTFHYTEETPEKVSSFIKNNARRFELMQLDEKKNTQEYNNDDDIPF